MAYKTPDRAKETCTGSGSGPLTLAGSPPKGFRTLAAAGLVAGVDTFPGAVENKANGQWQSGIWKFNGPTVELLRFHASSLGSVLSFAPGVKEIEVGPVGRPASWRIVTGNIAALPGDRLKVDTSDGPITVTLPAGPLEGDDDILFTDAAGTWSTNNLTIDANGNVFEDDGNPMVCADSAQFAVFFYDGKYRVR